MSEGRSTAVNRVSAPLEASTRPPSVQRQASARLEPWIAGFADPALLRTGRVNVISIEAVRERFGAGWPLRREQVHAHVDQVLRRRLGDRGCFLRASEVDYVVCQPGLGRLACQAACLRGLRELLEHFLGEAHLADNGVYEVTGLSRQWIEAAPIDARAVEAATRRPGVQRLASAELGPWLARFADPALLSTGRVNVISIEAVRDRFGTRWALGREQVHAHVDRVLQQRLGDRGFFLRASEVDYVVCQPGLGRLACQAACLRCLREILEQILDESDPADVGLHEVTRISGQWIEALRIDAREVENPELGQPAE